MKNLALALALSALLSLLAACAQNAADDYPTIPDDISWQTITAVQAYNMMSQSDDFILLDVRTQAEFRERHIDGAISIPLPELSQRAPDELPDKDAVILLYCQTGRRSALAAEQLAALGYTSIYDFGGIANWPH